MDLVLCGTGPQTAKSRDQLLATSGVDDLAKHRFLPFNDTDAYRLLKVATEAFVMTSCGVAVPPFAPGDRGLLRERLGLNADPEQLWNSYLEKVNGDQDGVIPYSN